MRAPLRGWLAGPPVFTDFDQNHHFSCTRAHCRFCVQAKKPVVKQSPGHVQMTDAQAKFFEYNVRKEEAERVRVFLGGHGTSKPSPIVSARVSH